MHSQHDKEKNTYGTCDQVFINKLDLYMHINICHSDNDEPYSCNCCGFTFRWKEHLMKHIYTHTGEKSYPSNKCGDLFTTSSNLKSHFLIYTG